MNPRTSYEPVDGLANRCLGPLDYPSAHNHSSFEKSDSQPTGLPAGGGGGIRTRGALRLAGFQDRWFRPLAHPSGDYYTHPFVLLIFFGCC